MDWAALERMSLSEILSSAMINEKKAIENYNATADLCHKAGNHDIASFFEEQADRETGHYNSLEKRRRALPNKESQTEAPEVMWVTGEQTPAPAIAATIDLDGALAMVEERERNAERFYRKAAQVTKDRAFAAYFDLLADEEAHHNYLILKLRAQMTVRGKIEETDYADLGFS